MTTPKFSRSVDARPGERTLQRIDATIGGRPAGFITWHKGSDGDYIWIKAVYVDPLFRGQKLGKAMIERVATENKGKELRLRPRPFRDARVPEATLRAMYQGMGFRTFDQDGRMKKTAEIGFVAGMEKAAGAYASVPAYPHREKLRTAGLLAAGAVAGSAATAAVLRKRKKKQQKQA